MKRFKKFLLNSFIMIISSFLLQIIRMIFNIYISKQISTEILGVFQLIMTTYIFGITLASSGINISCLKIVSEEKTLGNNNCIKKASKKCILLGATIGILASIIFCLNANLIVEFCFHNKVSTNIVYLIAIALPIISISSAISGYFIAIRKSI